MPLLPRNDQRPSSWNIRSSCPSSLPLRPSSTS